MTRRKSTTTAAPAPEPVEAAPAEQTPEQVTLVGRLCTDPVLYHTKSGFPVTSLRLAVQDTEPTKFIDAVVWRRQAEVCKQYLRKGRRVSVTGTLGSHEWTGRDGKVRRDDEIVARHVQFLNGQPAQRAANKQVA